MTNSPFDSPARSTPYWLRDRDDELEAMHRRLLESTQRSQGARALPAPGGVP